MRRRLALICLVLAAGILFNAPAGAIDRIDYKLNLLPTSRSLFGESPVVLAQDQFGFYWVASMSGGLARFDGLKSIRYLHKPDDPGSLASNRVQTVYQDRKRRLWIGTSTGLQQFDFTTERFVTVPLQIENGVKNALPSVYAVLQDRFADEVLWVGTRSGLFRIDLATGKQRHFTHQDQNSAGLPSKSIDGMAQDDEGDLWLRTGRGVVRLRPEPWRVDLMSPPSSSYGDGVVLMAYRGAMHAWYMRSQRIFRIDPASREHVQVGAQDGLPDEEVNDFRQDRSGRLWVANRAGLFRWDPKDERFQRFRVEADDLEMLEKPVWFKGVFEDEQGDVWMTMNGAVGKVGMHGAGFSRLLTTRTSVKSLWSNVPSLMHRQGGKLWIGSPAGLDRLDLESGAVKSYVHDPNDSNSLVRNTIRHAVEGQNGELYFSSFQGVSRYRPESDGFELLYEPQQRPAADSRDADQVVYVIAWDSHRHGLWVSTAAGLRLIDPETHRQRAFIGRHEFSMNGATMFYTSLLVDRAGTLWVGGLSGTLWVARIQIDDAGKPKLTPLPVESPGSVGLADLQVNCMFEDSSGAVWIGTPKGLYRAVADAGGAIGMTRYGVKQGLADDSIRSVIEDRRKNLWVATDRGITRIAADGKQVYNYFPSDGFDDRQFNSLKSNMGADGMLYFGQSGGGILAFNPDTLGQQRTITPRMALTGIAVMHEPLDRAALPDGVGIDGPNAAPRSLTLPYTHSVFSLGFAALGASDPASAVYAHKLDGFDRDWIRTDADRRIATYTNLEPGDYVFRVNATTMDGMRSPQDLVLPITITPPFWKTWWFRTLALALVVAATYWAHRLRIRFLQRSYELKTLTIQARAELDVAAAQQRFVAMVSHEFRNPLALMETALGNLSRMRGEMPAGVSERLQKIQRARQRMQGLIDNYLTEETMKSPDLNPRRQETALLTLVQDVVDYAQGAAPK
ncbi:sensor histidine kinase, partial [Noviherbaspirillum galbum]